jgi:sugar phosphate isomerase/epimerase
MKKAFVVSAQSTKFDAVAMKENLAHNLKKLSKLGYQGVELAIRNPAEVDSKKVKTLCNKYNLEMIATGTGQAWGEEKISLTDPNEETRKKAVERIKSHVNFVSEFGGGQIIIGLIRGMYRDDINKDTSRDWLIENIRKCADYAENYSEVLITIEPINRYETSIINNIDQAIKIIDKIDRNNVKILADTFHMNIEEANIKESIKKAKEYISHIHVADSNRWAPGWGHYNFDETFSTLEEIDYSGYISGEILPKPTPESCAEETIKYLKKYEN